MKGSGGGLLAQDVCRHQRLGENMRALQEAHATMVS